MKTDEIYTIKFVSRKTGLKPHILRTWEKRYEAVIPRRTESNRRIYSTDDIKRLNLLKKAVDTGHPISRIAALKTRDLHDLVDHSDSSAGSDVSGDDQKMEHCDRIVAKALEHIMRLDPPALEKLLERSAVSMTRQQMMSSIIQPIFERIGDMWAAGKLKIIHEHMATIVTRSILLDMLRAQALMDGAPKIVVAAPVGQWHESGALVAALMAAEVGWKPMYFGPNLPAEEIAAAVKLTQSCALALSISHRLESGVLYRELRKLKRLVGSKARLFVGGYVADGLANIIIDSGATCISDLSTFKSELAALKSSF